jgi:hypothetical protein
LGKEMITWGWTLCGIAIGRLISNALGPGNAWGHLIVLTIGITAVSVGFVRRDKELIEEARRNYRPDWWDEKK